MPRKKSENPPKWHHVAIRLTDEERAELVGYRDRHGLASLNGAVRHMIRGSK